MEGKLMDSLRFTDHARGQDILHILSSKQTVEPLLIEASGHDMLHEHFQFMDKITTIWLVFSVSVFEWLARFSPIKNTRCTLKRLCSGHSVLDCWTCCVCLNGPDWEV